jgi:biotin carboxylase
MSRPTLLVIGTGGREYREYLLGSIGRAYDVHLLLGAEPTWERPHVAGWTVVDMAGTVDAAPFLPAARAVRPDGVLTWDEARVLQAATVAAELGRPGGDPDAVLRCRDKALTRAALAAAGVPQAAYALVGSEADALAAAGRIGWPVVLKPRAMAASLGVVRVDTPAELAERYAATRDVTLPGAWTYPEVLVEELLTGPEVSVDAAVHRGVAHLLCVARKDVGYPPWFEEVGHAVDAGDPLWTDERLLGVVQRALTALGYADGVVHAELKLTPAGPKVIEVNARLGGDLIPYLGLRATGVDPGLTAASVACGRPPELRPDRALAAAVRFFYPEEDGMVVESVGFGELPDTVDLAVPLARPGDVVSPPPAGGLSARVAYATAVGTSVPDCVAALDAAGRALAVRVAEPVR